MEFIICAKNSYFQFNNYQSVTVIDNQHLAIQQSALLSAFLVVLAITEKHVINITELVSMFRYF